MPKSHWIKSYLKWLLQVNAQVILLFSFWCWDRFLGDVFKFFADVSSCRIFWVCISTMHPDGRVEVGVFLLVRPMQDAQEFFFAPENDHRRFCTFSL